MLDAVILAAGRGERLKPFTDTRPKTLIPIMEKPLIHYVMKTLRAVGVRRVFIVVHYLKEKIFEFLREGADYGMDVEYVDQGKPLGTGHALLPLADKIQGKFVVFYGDILLFSDEPLKKMVHSGNYAILATRVRDPWNYGVLMVREGRLEGVVEKPSTNIPSNLINGGVYVLGPEIFTFLRKIEPSPRGEIELTSALHEMCKTIDIEVVEVEESDWGELGKPWDILELNKRMLLKEVEGGKSNIRGVIEKNVVIKGPLIVEEEATILSGAYIEGPVYVGRRARVGPNCYIRPFTVIGEGVRVGNACEIKASVLMKGAHVSHLSYVGDSVLGEGVNFGAGTITANLRFDDKPVAMFLKNKKVSSGRRKLGAFVGDYVKTGVHVSFMPGVKVGAYSWIAPGAVIYRDVPPKSFVKVEEGFLKTIRRSP